MGKRVAIVGIGVTNCEERVDLSHKELLFQATRKALDDAGRKAADYRRRYVRDPASDYCKRDTGMR